MNLDSRFKLPYPGSDLYEFESYRRKLGSGPLTSFKMKTPKRMEKNISGRVEEKPKLVGFKTAAGCPVREQMVLVFFDEKLHRSSSAVDSFIDKAAAPVLKVSHNIAHKQPQGITLHLDDNPLWLQPALCLVEKLTEHFYRLLLPRISLLSFLHKLLRLFLQGIIGLEPKNIFYFVLFRELIHGRTTVIRVTPKENPHLRPGFLDPFYRPLEDRDDLLAWVLKKDGVMIVRFPSFWGPVSHHLDLVTRTPFIHWFIPYPDLLASYFSILDERGEDANWYRRKEKYRIPFEKGYFINGTGAKEFHRMIKDSWKIICDGFKYRSHSGNIIKNELINIIKLSKIPIFRELFPIAYILQKI